jgi:hypothetical protein
MTAGVDVILDPSLKSAMMAGVTMMTPQLRMRMLLRPVRPGGRRSQQRALNGRPRIRRRGRQERRRSSLHQSQGGCGSPRWTLGWVRLA